MNINSQISSLPLSTVVNPPTESLRRDNNLREVTPAPAPVEPSPAEKGVAREGKSSSSAEQVSISTKSKQVDAKQNTIKDPQEQSSKQETPSPAGTTNKQSTEQRKAQELADQQQISALQKRDQEVRSHESAHAAVGGSVTGAPSFSFERGPDGKNYAVNGEVSVDLSPVAGDPRATIAKMQTVHAAALAPINPSSQDKQVAAAATQTIAQAQTEILTNNTGNGSQQTRVKQNLRSNDISSNATSSEADQQSKVSADKQGENFDTIINSTLKAQEEISPKISKDVQQRALRIESFYSNINQAHTKPSSSQVELTA